MYSEVGKDRGMKCSGGGKEVSKEKHLDEIPSKGMDADSLRSLTAYEIAKKRAEESPRRAAYIERQRVKNSPIKPYKETTKSEQPEKE